MMKYRNIEIYVQNVDNLLEGDIMQNDDFKTVLRSKDYKKCEILSCIDIRCNNYETFKKIVDVVYPILEKEDVKKECD